jgi:hypothetical protein
MPSCQRVHKFQGLNRFVAAPFPRRSPAATAHPADRTYRLIVTDDPCKTFAQGEVRYFASMLDAGQRFLESSA